MRILLQAPSEEWGSGDQGLDVWFPETPWEGGEPGGSPGQPGWGASPSGGARGLCPRTRGWSQRVAASGAASHGSSGAAPARPGGTEGEETKAARREGLGRPPGQTRLAGTEAAAPIGSSGGVPAISRAMCWALAAALLGTLLLLLLALRSRRTRLPSEPPLDRGLVPWLGHAVEFGKDAASFLSKMKQKHGDIFTIQVAGKFITILLDPHSYDSVLWESSCQLDFSKYARLLMDRMFDVKLPDYDPNEEKVILRSALQNKNLPSLTKAMFFNLQTLLLSDPSNLSRQWIDEGLFNLSYGMMLRAGYLTLYGNEGENCNDPSCQDKDRAHSAEVYNAFYKLDQLLMRAARSMLTAAEKKEAASLKGHLWKLLSVKRLNSKANKSLWLESYKQHLEELGVDEDMQPRAMLMQLWATQGNAGPAVFWLLLFLLKHPAAMAAVQGELEKVIRNRGQTMKQMQGISQEMLDSTPVFDSALNETLRLTAAPFISREVLADMQLRLADGRKFSLRKEDRLCLFPYLSPQMDSEIYEEPEKFKYDRFLNADNTEKRDFYKGGERLKYYNMPWGAGINTCIGKFHAVNSIKQFVFILLTNFDLELKDPEARIPGFDKERYGFGMLQPENDIMIQYKLKD
ncbi:prostacyclin synthase [Mauremys mutica]|nr:prostacyclin synthase [Mauremys mutica]